MKIKDIPKEIAESVTVGELFVWNFICLLIDEIPESEDVTKIQELITARQAKLLEIEV